MALVSLFAHSVASQKCLLTTQADGSWPLNFRRISTIPSTIPRALRIFIAGRRRVADGLPAAAEPQPDQLSQPTPGPLLQQLEPTPPGEQPRCFYAFPGCSRETVRRSSLPTGSEARKATIEPQFQRQEQRGARNVLPIGPSSTECLHHREDESPAENAVLDVPAVLPKLPGRSQISSLIGSI